MTMKMLLSLRIFISSKLIGVRLLPDFLPHCLRSRSYFCSMSMMKSVLALLTWGGWGRYCQMSTLTWDRELDCDLHFLPSLPGQASAGHPSWVVIRFPQWVWAWFSTWGLVPIFELSLDADNCIAGGSGMPCSEGVQNNLLDPNSWAVVQHYPKGAVLDW